MTEEKYKQKEGTFDPGCVTDIYDTLLSRNYALRAFGALLRSSDLSDFADQTLSDSLKSNDYEKQQLRYGLTQMIELYLTDQEKLLSGYVDQYHNSDIFLLARAEDLVSMVEQGAFNSREASEIRLRDTVANMDTVINRHCDLEEKAHELKATCLKYIEQLTGKKTSGV